MVFDVHLRAHGLAARDVADLRWFGVEGALCPATDAVAPVTAARLRRSWEQLAGRTVPRLRRAGLAAWAALGVPPSCIPWRGLEALLADLPDLLSRPGVVAMGPIGLERATEREESVFARQLDMARELRLPVLVHTPSRDKVRVTRRVLAALLAAGVDARRVLVDHADARTVRLVRAVGYGAVISLSAGGRSGPGAVEEAAALVRALGPEGIALASDAGEGLGDLLSLPRAADRMERLGLSDAVIRRVCGRNALDVVLAHTGRVRILRTASPCP